MNLTDKNKNSDRNIKPGNKDKDDLTSSYFEVTENFQNKNPLQFENKKVVFAFYENQTENHQNLQTTFKARSPFILDKPNEKQAEELKLYNENNLRDLLKTAAVNNNPFENFTRNDNDFSNHQNNIQPEEGQENLEEMYNKRMNNFMNYFDRKQKEKENEADQLKIMNNFNKNRNLNNNYKNNFEDEDGSLNAKPLKRGLNVGYEDYTNSLYNVNRKKKNTNNNNYYNENKNKNTEDDDEEISSYNIYANKRKKKHNNRFNREEENESLSAGGELFNDNNFQDFNCQKNKYNNKHNERKLGFGYQNQLYTNKNECEFEDSKFHQTLKNGAKPSNSLVNKQNQNNFNNINNVNKERNSNDVANKYSVRQKFVPPKMRNSTQNPKFKDETDTNGDTNKYDELDKKLKGCDPKLIELIESEILSNSPDVKWYDIAGLEFAKKTIKEIIIWPMLRPDIFKGIRKPPKGLLLFGPPGTGKTMIAKAIASESKSSFFNISASSLMSKWIGESERLVRTLFALASFHQPSVVFIDEIDSILTSRSENENESSRRIKTEFLVQLDGAGTNQEDRILIIGATNRPQEIDEAFIRRLSKRLYIPLPNKASRKQLIENVISKESEKNNKYSINEKDLAEILMITKGYSGSDLMGVCREAAMMPIRCIEDILAVSLDNIRDVCLSDFRNAVDLVKPSVSNKTIGQYVQWNKEFGSFNFEEKDE